MSSVMMWVLALWIASPEDDSCWGHVDNPSQVPLCGG